MTETLLGALALVVLLAGKFFLTLRKLDRDKAYRVAEESAARSRDIRARQESARRYQEDLQGEHEYILAQSREELADSLEELMEVRENPGSGFDRVRFRNQKVPE